MEMKFGPDSVDEPNLLYKLQRKIKVFHTNNPLPNRGYNLVASSSKYGIVFIASPDGTLCVYYLKELVDNECEPKHLTIKLQEKPTHIAVSCDHELLAVTGGQLLCVYKVADFQNNNVSPSLTIRSDVNPSAFVSALQWNPCIPDTIAIAFYDGTLLMAQVATSQLKKVPSKNTSTLKPRIINVASHCGLQPLPGFAAYSASKAAVLAWTRALRLEHRLHGLSAVAFVPGGFVGSSNLISKQNGNGYAMLGSLNEEQKSFYEKNITTLTNYLQLATAHGSRYDSLKDENIIRAFVKALTDDNPKELYKVESWRYKFYYTLFKLPLPEAAHSWLINKFLNFPDPE